MGVHVRSAVVVLGVHGGHIRSAVLIELGQVPLQHRQVVQGKGAHAGELDVCGQVSRLVPAGQADRVVQLFRGVEALVHLPEVVLSDVLQGGGGLPVHHATVCNALLGADIVHGGLGHGHIGGEVQDTVLELPGVGHDEVAGGEVGHILVHVKAIGKVHRHRQQHHRQGQGGNCDGSLAPAAAQVGPGHGQQGGPARPLMGKAFPGGAAGFSSGPFSVPHRLDG